MWQEVVDYSVAHGVSNLITSSNIATINTEATSSNINLAFSKDREDSTLDSLTSKIGEKESDSVLAVRIKVTIISISYGSFLR